MRCAIVGLGAVGSAVYRDLVHKVPYLIGCDIDEARVAKLRQSGGWATNRLEDCADIDVWIICVSTDVRMETMDALMESLAPKSGAIVSVESTVQVGTMNAIGARFARRGFRVGSDLYLVHVPHRVMFGRDRSTLEMPRVIGGVTPECLEKGVGFYCKFASRLHPVADVRIAELAKIVENAHRYVDIAFAEALATYCSGQEIDFGALRDAVNTKENVKLASVDYGIGGACLPLAVELLESLFPSPVVSGAVESDRRYRRDLEERIRATHGTVLLRGMGYKPGVDDLAHSRAVDLARALTAAGRDVVVEDSIISKDRLAEAGLVPRKASRREERAYGAVVERGRLRVQRGVETNG